MKINILPLNFEAQRQTMLMLFLILLGYQMQGADDLEKERQIRKTFPVSSNEIVDLIHERGEMQIGYHDDTEAVIEVNLQIRGDVEEDVDLLLSKYTLDIDDRGNEIRIVSSMNIQEWNQSQNILYKKTKIRLKDGTVITSRIEDIQADLKLMIPRIAALKLTNKYHDIMISDLPFDLNVHQFSADVKAGDIEGNFTLRLKYGEAEIGDVRDFSLEAFDSKVVTKDAQNVRLVGKYSDILIGNCNSVDMELFDSELQMGVVSGQTKIEDKYSNISIKEVPTGCWHLFDSEVELGQASNLKFESKYTKIVIKQVNKLEIVSFDDHWEVEQLGELACQQSKYSEFDIGFFTSSMKFDDSFDDRIEVNRIVKNFNGFSLEGKYTEVNLTLSPEISYHLDADIKYGKINFDEHKIDLLQHIEKGDNLILKAKTKHTADQAANIILRGFDNRISLK